MELEFEKEMNADVFAFFRSKSMLDMGKVGFGD